MIETILTLFGISTLVVLAIFYIGGKTKDFDDPYD